MDEQLMYLWLMACIIAVMIVAAFVGSSIKESSLLTDYCSSTDYPTLIYIDGRANCTDNTTLKPIMWLED